MTETYFSELWKQPIADIKTIQLQNIMDRIELGGSSKRMMKSKLTAAFKIAYTNDIIEKNYASMLTVPSDQGSDIHKPFSSEELQLLWQSSHDTDVQLFLIYIYTGVRPGELLTINTSNIDLKAKTMIGGSKTRAGKNRIIPIANCILPFIKSLYSTNAFTHDKLLLAGMTKSQLSTKMKQVCKKYRLSPHLPHDTRHTFITLSSNYGMSEKILKMIVGHSRGRDTTQAVYMHKDDEQLIQAVNLLPYGINMTLYPDEKSGAVVEQ
jgi:integrase